MGRERGVIPDRVRLPLSDGDWVDVKKELTAGEYRQMLYSQLRDASETVTLDPAKVGNAKLLAYILGWSLVSVLDHRPIDWDPRSAEDIRRATLDDALDPGTYRELIAAIKQHEEQQAQKKTGANETLSSVT